MAGKPFLSLSMIVKNEETSLAACLASARALCDELVVVDTGSTDRTVEIARAHGARVFTFAWCDDFAAARNFALDRTTGQWVLHLDADEVAVAEPRRLRAELAAQAPEVRFLRVPVRSPWPDGIGCDEHPARRLFRREPRVRWQRRIHENITNLDGETPEQESTCRSLRVDHDGYRDTADRRGKGKLDRNIRLLTREILERPDDVVAHFYLAREYASQGENQKALQICQQILSRWSTRLQPFFEDAIRCQAMRSASACGETTLLVELGKPGEDRAEGSELPFLLGRAYLQAGELDAAERNFRRALALEGSRTGFQATEGTGTWRPLLELGTVAWRRGQSDEAMAQWHAALKVAPENPAVHLAVGKGLLLVGRHAEAAERLTRALEMKPDLHEAQLRLSEIDLAAGDQQAAYDRLQQLLDAHPDVPDHWHWLGSLLMELDQAGAAVEVLGAAIDRHQQHAPIYVALGAALEKLGRHEDAVNAFALAAAIDPKSDAARAGLGVAAYHRDQAGGAR